MVGEIFNTDMKAKLDLLCTNMSAQMAEAPRSTELSQGRHDSVSYRLQSPARDSWWPSDLGEPSSVGAQNQMRYAVFPSSQRLAISDGCAVAVYDTGDHRISGVAQDQSTDQTLTFTGQDGLVLVSELLKAAG